MTRSICCVAGAPGEGGVEKKISPRPSAPQVEKLHSVVFAKLSIEKTHANRRPVSSTREAGQVRNDVLQKFVRDIRPSVRPLRWNKAVTKLTAECLCNVTDKTNYSLRLNLHKLFFISIPYTFIPPTFPYSHLLTLFPFSCEYLFLSNTSHLCFSSFYAISNYYCIFHCFTAHFNSLNFTHQLMHFYIQ